MRECLRCGGGLYREHREGCAHAYALVAETMRAIQRRRAGGNAS
ncbi:MAG TPA: hypothetical protein VFS15_22545 [Kofleriaceae bacterium]|nr:hypothetical protein [Kofleriaceae bacterium]